VVTICTASLTFNNSTFCPHCVFVWISEQTAIISLHNINWLVCVNETEGNKLTKDWTCLFETQKDTQFYNWSNNDINIKFNNSRLNKALHQTIVGREVLTGELCAVQMDGGRLHVAFWRSECGASELETALTVLRDWQVDGETHRALSVQNMFCGYGVCHSALKVLCGLHRVCAFSTVQWHRLPAVCDAPHSLYEGAVVL